MKRAARRGVEAEVKAELEFHVEMRVRELRARGWGEEAARAEAMRGLGDVKRLQRQCTALGRSRDRRQRVRRTLAESVQDGMYALRQLRAAPGFAFAAVLTLALGVGGTTAIFSVVHAVVLSPFGFAHPERVYAIAEEWRGGAGDVSAGNFVDVQEASRSFAHMSAAQWSSFNVASDAAPERVLGMRVTHEFFDVFGVPPLLGRGILAEEDTPGNERVVVLSHALWEARFGSDAGVVGREVRLNGDPYTVVGVMPAGFEPFTNDVRLWVPIAFTPERRQNHDEHYLTVAALLAEGATARQAQVELDGIAADLRERFPQDNADRGLQLIPFAETIIEADLRVRLFVLLGAVGLVLLIACGNVANLLLARGASRRRELGIRMALGAGRTRLIRQLLTESLVLALVAAAAGVALAFAGVRILIAAAPPGVPRLDQATVDMAALLFALAASVISGILFGLAPAFGTARGDLTSPLREGARGTVGASRQRLRGLFVSAEVALSFTLLVGAGLLVRSAILLARVDVGVDAESVLTGRVTLPPRDDSGEMTRVAFMRLAEALAAQPGVVASGLSSQVPAGPGGNGNGLLPADREFRPEDLISSRLRVVTPGYLDAMGIDIVQGRDFTAGDVSGRERVMIISRRLAEQAWPGLDPIGRQMLCCEGAEDDPRAKTIVGVVEDVQWRGPGQTSIPEFYLPVAQVPLQAFTWIQGTMTLVVRGAGDDPTAMAPALRAAVSAVRPDVPVFDVSSMDDRLRGTFATSRFNAKLLAVLGVTGLVLAVIGIYGVVAYHTSRRIHEIGLRMALGARHHDVIALITRQGLAPVMIGLAAGAVGALAVTRVLRNTLFGVSPTDPFTFGIVGLLLFAAALSAIVVPARRASRLDPGQVLTRG